MKHRNDIDGLRAIAVLSVVVYHFAIYMPVLHVLWAPFGYIGVDVFFVISGFLITKIIYEDVKNGSYSIANFYNRRIRRIFPALFAIFFFCAVAFFLVEFPTDVRSTANGILSSTLFLSNVYFYRTVDYFSGSTNPLLHTWSLSVEEQFYVLFPLLIYSIKGWSHKWRIAIFISIAIASFFYCTWEFGTDPKAAFYLLQSRVWELLIGSLLAIGNFPNFKVRWQAELAGATGLLLLLAFVAGPFGAFVQYTPIPSLAGCLGAALIIYSGATVTTVTGWLLGGLPIRFIGLISYSLYLWHWPLFVLFNVAGLNPTNHQRYFLVALCIVVATLSWRFIERPFRNPPFYLHGYRTIAAAGLVMAISSLLSVSLSSISERYWSFPDRVNEILTYADYTKKDVMMRTGTCFLSGQTFESFNKNDCLATKPGKNILIFGDSHAAHLWYGLQTVYPNVNFLQATVALCAPLVDDRPGMILGLSGGGPACAKLRKYIFKEFLPRHHLDAIIMAGAWRAEDLGSIKQTAKTLRPFANTIYVFGPTVEYDQSLPRLLALGMISHDADVPKKHLAQQQGKIDKEFDASIPAHSIEYVSVYHAICDPKCAIFAGNGEPIQWDYGHLTMGGSIYVAAKVGIRLFGNEDNGNGQQPLLEHQTKSEN
jgi:peptidoglycan/LPS O-acetylase OafA/YrhL